MTVPLLQPMPTPAAAGVAAHLAQAVRQVQSYLAHRRPTFGLALAPPPLPGAPPWAEVAGTILWPVRALIPPGPRAAPLGVPRAALPVVIVNIGYWTARLAVTSAGAGEAGYHFALLAAPSRAGARPRCGSSGSPCP